LIYKEGEQARDWYQRYSLTAGALDPLVMPYYLLIVGPPDLVPFEFQYLLGVDYAVGRLAFDAVADYGRYVSSLLDYEGGGDVPNAKEVVYWGTQHTGDGATRLSSTLLIGPLANGDPNAAGALKKPVHSENGFGCEKLLADDATRDALLAALHKQKPPALLFTASHGMSVNSGGADQGKIQGALLCQDWSGFGRIKPSDYLTAADVPDDANVKGIIVFIFACFGGGTPDVDQFLLDPNQAGHLAPLAPQPFMAALPQRLLAHPKGGALAVVAHVDRAWGYSIQAPKMSGAQINTFRNSLESAMCGDPIGHAIHDQFGGHFAVLSTALLSALSPTAAAGSQLSDRDIVTYWLQRNDAQNYVTLGDPAARIRADKLA
jgi:Peptidase family C25